MLVAFCSLIGEKTKTIHIQPSSDSLCVRVNKYWTCKSDSPMTENLPIMNNRKRTHWHDSVQLDRMGGGWSMMKWVMCGGLSIETMHMIQTEI